MSNSSASWKHKADAYLQWAIHTKFRHVHPAPSKGKTPEVGLLVEDGKSIETATKLADALISDPASALADVVYAELASPIAEKGVGLPPLALEGLTDPVVLGVIDDSCPFAQPSWRERIPALWDQEGPAIHMYPGYGRVLFEDDLAKYIAAGGRTDWPDDLNAYESAGMPILRRRATHGSHVMDLLGGPRPPRARVSPSREVRNRQDGSAHEAPPWSDPGDPASQCKAIFVQLPKAAVEDPTGRWLGFHALNGLDFILSALKQGVEGAPAKRVIVNLSWGPQTGPHDGTSLIERAFVERAECQLSKGWKLSITLPAGNSYGARAHAQFDVARGSGPLVWRVPPGQRTPTFLEIWWPSSVPKGKANVHVKDPTGRKLDLVGEDFAELDGQASLTRVLHGGRRPMVLLALAATDGKDDGALHGAWEVRVNEVAKAEGTVHVYLARQVANMGGRRRGPDGHLHDALYEEERRSQVHPQDVKGSLVQRQGTLNGLATSTNPTVMVVGGAVLNRRPRQGEPADRGVARYSSSGPGTHEHTVRNPDEAIASDESSALRGIRASGVRSGSSFRLIGTSAAAPQIARKIANPVGRPRPPGSQQMPEAPSRVGSGVSTPMASPIEQSVK